MPSLGQTVFAHCSSLGKAVVAGLPGAQRDLLPEPEPYAQLAERTITDRATLDAELARTVAPGFASDEEETEIGLWCLGAAIRGPNGQPWAAISISGLTNRMCK